MSEKKIRRMLMKEQRKAQRERSKQLDKEYSLREPLTDENKTRIAVISVLAVLCAGVWAWSGIFA